MENRYRYNLLLLTALAIFLHSPVNPDAMITNGEPVKLSSHASQGGSLRLVGMALAGDPQNSLAVIEDQESQRQWFYSEGQSLGHILIKKIQRDRIIINAGNGEEVVKLKRPLAAGVKLPTRIESAPLPVLDSNKTSARQRSIALSRERVASALKNIDQTLKNVYISSGMPFNNPPGFRITSFERDSIFGQMGLRNQDLVLSVNGEEFQGSEQAASFLQKIRDGGDLDIKIRRRARTHHIHLKIE